MINIMKYYWGMYKDELREALSNRDDLEDITYEDLVKLIFRTFSTLDLDKIEVIDNGDYQGCMLFIIPFDTYQPDESEHIMTYIGYGSCSGCDALEAAKCGPEEKIVSSLMSICDDIVNNTIRPYNHGWRYSKAWDFAEIEEVKES